MQLFVNSSDICKESEDTEKYANHLSDDIKCINCSYIKAEELALQGEYEQSLELHKKILEIRCQGSDLMALADSLNSIGCLYMIKNDFTKANQYFCKALKYRSLENDLIGFCTVHVNLSKMYYLQSLYTNDSIYLTYAMWSLYIALAHLSEKRTPELYKSWKIKYIILQAQMLRFSSENTSEKYREILSELMSFTDAIKENPQFGMQNNIMTAENNIAIIFALMGKQEQAEQIMTKCLSEKESAYDITTNSKNTPCSITRNNLKAIKENRLQDLIFEY